MIGDDQALTQADEYGADGLAGLEDAASVHGFDLAARLSYQSTATDVSAQAGALKASGAESVFMPTQSCFTGKIPQSCAEIGFLPTFIGNYVAFKHEILAETPALKPLLAAHWKTSGPFAHRGEDVPGMKRMLDAIGRYAPDQKPDPLFVQGWTRAEIITEALGAPGAGTSAKRKVTSTALPGGPRNSPGWPVLPACACVSEM